MLIQRVSQTKNSNLNENITLLHSSYSKIIHILDEEDSEYYVAGVDISFVKGDAVNACAALVILSFPDLEVSYAAILASICVFLRQ